jgi:signal transduction histidine kinase
MFKKVINYTILSFLVTVSFALLVTGLGLFTWEILPRENYFAVGFIFFIIAVLLIPIREWLQTLVDRLFFRGDKVYKDLLQEFAEKIDPKMEITEISEVLKTYISETIIPLNIHLFIIDSLRDQYIATEDETGYPSTDIQFSANSPLTQVLSRDNSLIYIDKQKDSSPGLAQEKNRLALLDAVLLVPLPGRTGQVIGFLVLSSKQSGDSYSGQELKLLTSLCDQSAVVIERSQVVANLERRVNEMNVLTRVAQGINITLRFDDILELIYAQVNRIIPTRDFWILLFDNQNEYYYYAFYLEDDRRLLQHENHPLAGELDLAQEVIRTGQGMSIVDFEHESRSRGILPHVEGIFAWAAVPLNAGAETFGAMSLGSRDSSVLYPEDQVELLQAIADQAAGAIVKARLLEESERSARQLNLLNQVAKNLTSTLDFSSLLDQILDNAFDFISCEAGTLFLVDEDTGELIFEVVKGPVAEELLGTRLAPGTGHVGKSVETGKAAVVNEVRHTREWSRREDQKTGFVTRNLLVIPMFAQDRVVGVIELINRKDGLPFTKDDQDLLTAFSSQAAIALDNARLYTLTDRQLAERVDELSVMQRIDRELNASLDVTRAMRITLEWAMRLSGADAGLVGSVSPEGVKVMADQGYRHEENIFMDELLPIELPGIKLAIDNEQTQQFTRNEFSNNGQEKHYILDDAQIQIIIPIRREESVIGLLLLESFRNEPWGPDVKDFLSRLSDHAAISIANAQLFAQVQDADIAKSDFVSFVSHELKTPMTSIRGYSDLLLAGAVGEINEAQEDFLTTIRTNVNRMATLVSDLADVSRIEAGRLKLDFSPVGLPDAVREVVRSQEHSIGHKGLSLEMDMPSDLAPAWGDKVRIVQILTNLISNAIKYTPERGRITIEIKESHNRWNPDGAQEVLLIAIKDTGIGLEEADQNMIFTKFFRSADPKAREVPGTGLGLNITKYLVEMQGGLIWFESTYGSGTTFYFTLPIAEV